MMISLIFSLISKIQNCQRKTDEKLRATLEEEYVQIANTNESILCDQVDTAPPYPYLYTQTYRKSEDFSNISNSPCEKCVECSNINKMDSNRTGSLRKQFIDLSNTNPMDKAVYS